MDQKFDIRNLTIRNPGDRNQVTNLELKLCSKLELIWKIEKLFNVKLCDHPQMDPGVKFMLNAPKFKGWAEILLAGRSLQAN